MTITDLLAAFGEKHTGKPLALDNNGVCQLAFHEGRSLTVEPVDGSDQVFIYSALAPLPARDAANVYGKLLAANLFGEATGGAWFALDPSTEEILLNRAFETTHMDADAFGQLVTGFMDTVEIWQRELEGPEFGEIETEPDEGPAGAQPPGRETFIVRG